ncbi:MAG: PEGA domain-containing protein [Terriglobales bacterium]
MSLKRTLSIVLFLGAALSSLPAQDQGRRIELEESLQSRYRLTTLGGGFMGVHGGDNAIRRAGGIVILVRDGLYGSYDRGRLASNAIQNGKTDVFSGDKDVALERGEKLYVTAIHVGSDAVTMGLLSARMIPGSTKTSQVWCTANFFFTKDTLAQGDIGKVYSVIDQWLVPEGAIPALPPSVSPTASVPAAAAPPANPVDLKPGMTRDEIVSALGTPLQEAGFGDHRWLTYPGITITLEQGKLTSVERNAQALVPVRISSVPGGADVFLDGSFVSSTPAVLRLQAGTYKVAVKMSGYADWEREIKILPGAEVNLNARLSR